MYLDHQQKNMLQTKFTFIWIKFGELICQICVCYLRKYLLYESETIRNRLLVI